MLRELCQIEIVQVIGLFLPCLKIESNTYSDEFIDIDYKAFSEYYYIQSHMLSFKTDIYKRFNITLEYIEKEPRQNIREFIDNFYNKHSELQHTIYHHSDLFLFYYTKIYHLTNFLRLKLLKLDDCIFCKKQSCRLKNISYIDERNSTNSLKMEFKKSIITCIICYNIINKKVYDNELVSKTYLTNADKFY